MSVSTWLLEDTQPTLRDCFAAAALPAVISACAEDPLPPNCTRVQYFASQAMLVADAMLEAREALHHDTVAKVIKGQLWT